MTSNVRKRSPEMADTSSIGSGSDVTGVVGMRKTLGLIGGSSYVIGVMIGKHG